MTALLLPILLLSSICYCLGSELELVTELFKNYNHHVRPVKNHTTISRIGMKMQILSLLEVNGKEEYIKVAIFLKAYWKDEYLTWDPKKWGGIEYMRLPATMVWLPDICVITSSSPTEEIIPRDDTLIGLFYNGSIDHAFPFVLYNSCPMESQKFPFDTQKCLIKVTSWKYPNTHMLLEHTMENNTLPRNPNTEWEIFKYTNMSKDWHRELSTDIYSQLWYTLTMKRRSTYYVWVIIIPTFVISALSIAGIFAPFNNLGDREEKVTLGLTTLLTLAVILSLVTGDMPKGSALPVLGLFVLIQIIVCTASMAVSVVLLFLHQRATVRAWVPPKWLSFCFKTQVETVNSRKNTYHYVYRNSIQPVDNNGLHPTFKEKLPKDVDELRQSMRQISDSMTPVRKYLEKLEESHSRNEQWGIIFDRLDLTFFFAFQIINVLSLALIFSQV